MENSNIDTLTAWDTPENCRHNVRVLCDLAELDLNSKNIITACVEQESNFNPKIEGRINSDGSHDWGICQFNDGSLRGIPLWIGSGAFFASTEEVVSNPEKCVNEMIAMYKAGHINWWVSYSSGAYLKYMPATSTS